MSQYIHQPIKLTFILILTTFFLTGCLHQKERGVSSNLVNYLYPDGKRTDHSSDQVPHLKLPLRVGIAFIPESISNLQYSLSEAEKSKLLANVSSQFENLAYVESIEIIPQLYMRQGRGFSTISQIASIHDIDVMALVSYDHLSGHL